MRRGAGGLFTRPIATRMRSRGFSAHPVSSVFETLTRVGSRSPGPADSGSDRYRPCLSFRQARLMPTTCAAPAPRGRDKPFHGLNISLWFYDPAVRLSRPRFLEQEPRSRGQGRCQRTSERPTPPASTPERDPGAVYRLKPSFPTIFPPVFFLYLPGKLTSDSPSSRKETFHVCRLTNAVMSPFTHKDVSVVMMCLLFAQPTQRGQRLDSATPS